MCANRRTLALELHCASSAGSINSVVLPAHYRTVLPTVL